MKHALITGVTGTLGTTLSRLLLQDGWRVTGISRDEQKQRQMPGHENLHLRLADVRDGHAVERALDGLTPNVIFHLAALKCVDTLEFHPEEAFATNVLGTGNMIDIAKQCGSRLVFTSTDKAAYPINAYGMSKALAERMVLKAGFQALRYGNVIGSRGSFIPNLILSLKSEGKAYITHPEMTRFWMSIGQAARFVLSVLESTQVGKIQVPEGIQAASLPNLVAAVASFCGVEKYETVEIGIRPGEKIHETLVTSEEGELMTSADKAVQFHPKSLERFLIDVLQDKV